MTRKTYDEPMFPLDSLAEKPSRVNDNGHKISGSVRDAANHLIKSTILSSGCSIHEITPSDYVSNDTYECQHYAPNDLKIPIRFQRPPKGSAVCGIDIDYFIEDLTKVMGYGNPALFHTFNPRRVSGIDGDCHFTIDQDTITYNVGGGGSWKHRVWDWTGFGEFIRMKARDTGILGWFAKLIGLRKFYIYKIHHARPWSDCPDRLLVWALCHSSYWKFLWIEDQMNTREIERVRYTDPNKPGWNLICDEENMVSFGRNGELLSGRLPREHFELLNGLKAAQAVTTRMLQLDYKDPELTALMGQYFANNVREDWKSMRTLGRGAQVKVHWPLAAELDVPECSARAYGSPIVGDHNLMPMTKRLECLSDSIDERVTFVKNDRVPNRMLQILAAEFVMLMVPEPGTGVPYSLEQTREMLNKPSQVLAINQIWDTVDAQARALIECFVKNEPTNKSGRIISSFADMRFLLEFSKFTLNFRDNVLHSEANKHFFMPGNTPQDIAAAVCQYVQSCDEPIEGDFSNFDGSVSSWCQRHIMNAVYHRYFNRDSVPQLRKYTDMLIKCPARAKNFGFRYDAGVGVKSGSPTTCDLNTVLNAFMQYAAIRLTDPSLSKQEAYQSIGLAFGDDSLFERRYEKQFQKVAKKLGMELKVVRYKLDEGITFLARVFPDPLNTLTSFQDPLRTWRKLHLTTRDPNIPIADAACDRVEGYIVTDTLTPVTSAYCEMIQRVYQNDADSGLSSIEKRRARRTADREKPYWLTTGGTWPQLEDDIPLMVACISARCGVDECKIVEYDQMLRNSKTVWFSKVIEREEEIPYKNTVCDEGEIPGEVDHDKLIIKKKIQDSRFSNGPNSKDAKIRNEGRDRNNAGSSQMSSKTHRGSDKQSAGRPKTVRTVPKRTKRSQRSDGISGNVGKEDTRHNNRDQRPPHEAKHKPIPRSGSEPTTPPTQRGYFPRNNHH